jgi:hypothetical protein
LAAKRRWSFVEALSQFGQTGRYGGSGDPEYEDGIQL